MATKQRRIRATPDDTLTSATSSFPPLLWVALRTLRRGLTLSRVQPVVGTLAGAISIAGAALSLAESVRPTTTGTLVATVQAADPRRSVGDAVIEVLTTENAIVATLTPDVAGRVTKELTGGVYVVRVRHPQYVPEVHRIQVLPEQSVEIRATLRPPARTPRSAAVRGSSSPIERAVGGGVNAVRKVFRF